MNRYKYLMKNISLLTIGSFSTRLLSFFLVPLYTNYLTTENYGHFDLISTTISLLIPVLTCNVADGVLRFSIEEKTNRIDVLVIGIYYFAVGNFVLVFLLGINYWINWVKIFSSYFIYFLLLFCATSFCGILSAYARGTDKVKEVSVSGIAGSLCCLLLNIYLLVYAGMGIKGYFIANIIGIFMQCLILVRAVIEELGDWKYKVNKILRKKVINYSVPLIASNIGWWINNASDRYIVTYFMGAAENGVYSFGYKIPSIITAIQSIFQQAWTLSAAKSYNQEDAVVFFSNIYKIYNLVLVLSCSLLIILDKTMAHFLFANDFYNAWKYVPILLIAMVFSSMAYFEGGIFIALKDTAIIVNSTLISAAFNMVFNIFFVYSIGTIGAAISTGIAYLLNWVIRHKKLYEKCRLNINLKRDLASYLLLVMQALIVYAEKIENQYILINLMVYFLILGLYIKELNGLVKRTRKRYKI